MIGLASYANLDESEKVNLRALLLTEGKPPIFISTSQGIINLSAIAYIESTQEWIGGGLELTRTAVIHLSCGHSVILDDTNEVERFVELLPTWIDISDNRTSQPVTVYEQA